MQSRTSIPPDPNSAHSLLGTSIRRVRAFLFNQYLASLVGTLFVMPIVDSIITVLIYIQSPSWHAILWGTAITFIIWLCSAFPLSHFATAAGANRRSYNLLINQLTLLKVRLDTLKELQKLSDKALPKYSHMALKEVEACYTALHDNLITAPNDLRWVSGTGYLDAWATLHEAQEALIEVEPVTMVLNNALYDKARIQDSTIKNADGLLSQLEQAIKDLTPAALDYFKEHPQEKVNVALQREMQKQSKGITQIARALKTLHPNMVIDWQEHESPDEEVQARARVALRRVRHTINDFRDTIWDGLLRGRNHLMFCMTLTGLVTYMLLCLVLMSNIQPQNMVTASIFYVVGAITGMFGRFYREANTRAAVDDYGLTIMRVFATPLLSGLAGIGGVFITLSFADSLYPSVARDSLTALFLPSTQLLLAAAFFGLTPNLIIRSLQQRAEKYASDLKSSKSGEEMPT